MQAAGYYLGLILRKLIGAGKPGAWAAVAASLIMGTRLVVWCELRQGGAWSRRDRVASWLDHLVYSVRRTAMDLVAA